MELGGDLQKMIHMFTGDLYSMYVVCKELGVLHCLTCIRVKYHIRNFVWGVATLDVWSSSTRTFQPKKRIPRNDQFLFILCLKKWVFQAHRRVPTPHDWCRRTMKKELFCKENQWNRVVILKKIKFYPKYFYPKTQKNVQSAGFRTCFRYRNIVIPMAFALALFMHSKILPQIQICLPEIF